MADRTAGVVGDIGGGGVAPKLVTGVTTDQARKLMLLACRGPLDVSDTVVVVPYCQLKYFAGQLIAQEGEAELLQLTGRAPAPTNTPDRNGVNRLATS